MFKNFFFIQKYLENTIEIQINPFIFFLMSDQLTSGIFSKEFKANNNSFVPLKIKISRPGHVDYPRTVLQGLFLRLMCV